LLWASEKGLTVTDLSEYTLGYINKETGELWRGRNIDSSSYKLYNEKTGVKISISKATLRKEYKGIKENLCTDRKRKTFHFKGLGIYNKKKQEQI
jgi:hypothetical protein